VTKYVLEEATKADDASLRELMRGNVMPGPISVTFRREPSFFAATSIFGDECHVMKCTDTQKNSIITLASRVRYKGNLNGKIADIGYYSDLRIVPEYRNGTILKRVSNYMNELHNKTLLPIYITLILDGNKQAQELFSSKRAGLAAYKPLGKFLTPLIRLDRQKRTRLPAGLTLEMGSADKTDEIFDFINLYNSKKQFAPLYSPSDLGRARLRGLKAEDFFLARKDGELVGVIAAWDQEGFRQTHVEKYGKTFRFIRPFYNYLSYVTSFKPMPKEGERIPYFSASHIAVKDDNKDIFRFLLQHLYLAKRKGGWQYFVCGLHEKNPLSEVLNEYSKFDAGGELYSVCFDGSEEAALDNRVPHIEIAAL